MTDETDADRRDQKGRFAPGNKIGKGRARVRPLRDVVTFEVEAQLWAKHLGLAMGDDDEARGAREFVLRHVSGNPYQGTPDIPPIAWPLVMTVEDLAAAVGAALNAHSQGTIDGAGLTHLVDLIAKLSRVFEAVETAPKLRKLEEYIEAQGGSL